MPNQPPPRCDLCDADAAVPLGSRAAALYEDFAGAGNGGLDFSAIIKTY